MTTIATNDDGTFGITILSDGTRAYWTEGRSSTVVFRLPDGTIIRRNAADGRDPLVCELHDLDNTGADEYRELTAAEVAEWEAVR